MIKAGIIGASYPMAGELIRILINHPDVALMWVESERYAGRLVSDVHHGLIGETDLRITTRSANRLSDIDVLFVFRDREQSIEWLERHEIPEDLRIVDLGPDMRDPVMAKKYDYVYGLPELNRKPMVRGAKRAVLPHPAVNLSALALMPLAKHRMLRNPVEVNVSMPEAGEQVESSTDVADELTRALRELDPEFDELITIVAGPGEDNRAISAMIDFDTTLDIGELLRAYEEFYDDHNFTFLINRNPEPDEVDGTNKCLIRIDKRDGRATVTAIMDALIKGAAGTAVHDMNLLFGLHERVALALKASNY